jgi:YVTN family beta-propeller protein
MWNLPSRLAIAVLLLVFLGTACKKNEPPFSAIGPTGPDICLVNKPCTLLTHTADPDEDDIRFQFDWGDGVREWTGYYPSRTPVQLAHSWSAPGRYVMRALAQDEHGSSSQWSRGCSLTVADYPYHVAASIPFDGGPMHVAVLPSGDYVYVTDFGGINVFVIRTSDDTAVAAIRVGAAPWDLAVLPSGDYVYVTTGDSITVIRTSDNVIVTTIPVGSQARGVAALPNGEYVYVGCGSGVAVIRTSDNTVTATIPLGSWTQGVAALPDGDYVYVTNASDSVSKIRTSDCSVVATIPVGLDPMSLAVLPHGDYVYVANLGDVETHGGMSVSVIRTADDTVVATIWTANVPGGIAAHPSGNYVYLSYPDQGVWNNPPVGVSVISTVGNTVVATIPVDACNLEGVAVSPDGNRVYVADLEGYIVVLGR